MVMILIQRSSLENCIKHCLLQKFYHLIIPRKIHRKNFAIENYFLFFFKIYLPRISCSEQPVFLENNGQTKSNCVENIAVITQLAWSTIFCVAQKKDLHRKIFCGAQPFHTLHSNFFTLYSKQCKLAVHFSYAHD